MRPSYTVTLFENIHTGAARAFEQSEHFSTVNRLETSLSGDALLERLNQSDVIGIRSRTQLNREVLLQAPNLKAIGAFCIGTNQIDLDAAAELGIAVFNAPHANTRSVAELVLAESVMLLRQIPDKNRDVHAGQWSKSAAGSFEIRNKTLGIVGYGHIGSQVSILAEAFGMQVLFYDVQPKLAMGNAQAVDSLSELLQRSDIVTLHVPAAADTVNLMSRERIGEMKEGACLINASRGTVVDIEALADARRGGHIAGAAIDVFPKEPKAAGEVFESALCGLSNILLTPHIGGSTQEAQQNIGKDVSGKLLGYMRDGSTTGSVNMPELAVPSKPQGVHRVLHIHHNRPGILRKINDAIAEPGANIKAQYLQTKADIGFMVADIEMPTDSNIEPDALFDGLKGIDGTLRCRYLN